MTSCKRETTATTIISDALQAHGGIERWNNTEELSYLKTTILYDSLGNIETKIVQKHKNIFGSEFEAQIQWTEDTINKKVVLKNDKVSVYFNDVPQTDPKLQEKYYKAIIAANYVIWQPYKLLDKDVMLSYQGEDTIDDKKVDVVKAEYFNDDGSPANTWWYYFDQKTNRLVGNMVHHGTTYSYIKNLQYENQTGLFLNAERKSYMTDSLRNTKFLRAHYFYEAWERK
ncbi:DUF6503 family protein [Aquimarina sp. 2201CG14-23]|uniref:DUF6503 family protein n=1 Tax=Aquimarina mycalae TaxID=3040073 RepID=UPI002477FC9B|nr:DUF6503 family protein [Aquimarina sp. 2201CG14-23]MDH7447406.1 hypothetical protein [Aquimarina sp. 2201CG14-23]